jgi:hypothetical protein
MWEELHGILGEAMQGRYRASWSSVSFRSKADEPAHRANRHRIAQPTKAYLPPRARVESPTGMPKSRDFN